MARLRVQSPECKTYLHAWDEYHPPKDMIAPRVLACWKRLCLRCERCATARHDGIDENGDVVAREYLWPDGYRDSGDERPTRAELRLFIVTRRPTTNGNHHRRSARAQRPLTGARR